MNRDALAIAGFGFAAGAAVFIVAVTVQPPTTHSVPPDSFAEARRAVALILKDPESARFGQMFQGKLKATVCGAVNAKNGFGGYVGMTPFVYFNGRAELITDPPNDGMSPDGLEAYHRACR